MVTIHGGGARVTDTFRRGGHAPFPSLREAQRRSNLRIAANSCQSTWPYVRDCHAFGVVVAPRKDEKNSYAPHDLVTEKFVMSLPVSPVML